MLQYRTLPGLLLGAGLWLTATASLAAPQPGLDMTLGDAALPPSAFMDFCQRRPGDCGEAPDQVRDGVLRARRERAALMSLIASPPEVAPAATPGGRALRPIRISFAPAAQTELAPPPVVLESVIQAREVEISVTFIDPAARDRGAASAIPTMDPKLWRVLNRVNARTNRAIVERTDLQTYGRSDYWTTPLEDGVASGDCEDYVLEKKRALIAAGVPRRALNIALVTTPLGEAHAVLLVATSKGEFVLDNLTPWIVPWREAGYLWRQRQVDGDAFHWAMVRQDTPTSLRLASVR